MGRRVTNARLKLAASLLVVLAALTTSVYLRAQEDSDRALYDNDVLFGQLPSGGPARLILKFGQKPSGDAGAALVERFSLIMPQAPTAPAPANVAVNNPSADTTNRDTQSETTLVLGSGSTIVVGFND